MTRGTRKHLKRLNAPKSWRLDKSSGKYAPAPSSGPHSKRECIPLTILLRRKLKVSNSEKELAYILGKGVVLVNGVVRKDKTFPLGLMDVLTIKSTNEHYRVLYDVFRKFVLERISDEEAKIRLCKVIIKKVAAKNVPYIYTKDGSSFRYCDPQITKGDTVVVDLVERKVVDFLPLANDMKVFVTEGKNTGCVGIISCIEKHDGRDDVVNVVDAKGRSFTTKSKNVIVIGDSERTLITLPKGDGIKLSEVEKSNERFGGPVMEETKVSVDEE
ncbi:40S ribosomal S4-3 [Tubulinosema ratisbonensis]|uniref:40S ribosomal protein S4 n=1 Tax=Tubulinosema ratisbonensis TaxID=291195 RepID=A0A437AQX0_9MICR|nr:40S ribosomal S4-3 [Tubulinosema ratisbonensis]